MRYFMSYVYTLPCHVGDTDEPHYGCCVTDDSEHPIERIERWGRERNYRRFVLLWWKEVTDQSLPELESET